jgi:translation initiation factor 2 beta subunit (eIF-2beta)/eIF-5
VNIQSPKQIQPINSKTTHKTIRIPSIESNQSKEKTIFQEMQDTDIQYRNDNIQNVDYLCQKCGFSTAKHLLGSSPRVASVILSFCNNLSA